MTNWKHYAGSILLAGLLLQGCGSTEDSPTTSAAGEQTSTLELYNASSSLLSNAPLSTDNADLVFSNLIIKLANLDATDSDMTQYIDGLIADNDTITTRQEAYKAVAEAIMSNNNVSAAPRRGVLSGITDTIKDGLVDIMDSSLGDAITGAAFDVVLNSDGVTVFMLDQARNSQTITDIMINALDSNWDLTRKMCPMLQTNAEFGEKFVALADERDNLARFFFEKIDATMYGCLTDAMILSSDEDVHDESVNHSTTGYMGLLLEKYATDYFIEPGTGSNPNGYEAPANTDQFASLMFQTGETVAVDGNTTSGHGDANELINEQFFYAMFRTPTSTDSFVAAMDLLPVENVTMFMDEIFLGQQNTSAFGPGEDEVQGFYNIISIAGGMYEGIETYGFGTYTDAFIGFAGLIPSDRYFAYGSQFMSAGYFWAEQNGVDIWGSVVDGAKELYANFTTDGTDNSAAGAPARSAGLGTLGSDWISDTWDVVVAAWDNSDLLGYFGSDLGIIDYYNNEALKAYSTVIGSPDSNLTTVISSGESVRGFHGLLELAIREDIYNTQHEVNASYTMIDATAAFALPAFSEITWDFAYNSAENGVASYWNDVVDAAWLADLSSNDLVRQYFYPSADNVYIPSWLMAIDWLKLPDNVNTTDYSTIDFSFDAGYMDIYVVSSNGALTTDADLALALAPIKDNIEFTQIDMSSDSIIAVDASGLTLDGLYVYKIRVVTPEDTAAVLAALSSLGNSALNAIGIDTDNAAQTVATAE